jgi:hypothetical protein
MVSPDVDEREGAPDCALATGAKRHATTPRYSTRRALILKAEERESIE